MSFNLSLLIILRNNVEKNYRRQQHLKYYLKTEMFYNVFLVSLTLIELFLLILFMMCMYRYIHDFYIDIIILEIFWGLLLS